MAKNKEKAGAGRTIVILLVVLLLLLTAGAYGYGVYYFSSHFLPGSMVNGFNCSYMASEDTEDLLNQRVGAYVLAVETMKNGQEAISAQDVGLSYVSTGIVKQLIRTVLPGFLLLTRIRIMIFQNPSAIMWSSWGRLLII